MKYLKRVWILQVISMLLVLTMSTAVSGSELPLAAVTVYEQDGKVVNVLLVVPEEKTLESFTISVKYNMDVYKLYNGNDEVLGGYMYTDAYTSHCQSTGMLASNAIDGEVFLSGIDTANEPYHGTIAIVSLLKYSEKQASQSDISVEIKTIREKNSISIQDVTISPKKTEQYPDDLQQNNVHTTDTTENASKAEAGNSTQTAGPDVLTEYTDSGDISATDEIVTSASSDVLTSQQAADADNSAKDERSSDKNHTEEKTSHSTDSSTDSSAKNKKSVLSNYIIIFVLAAIITVIVLVRFIRLRHRG